MKRNYILKKKLVTFSMAALLGAGMVAPTYVYAESIPGTKAVETTSELTVNVPDGVTGDYSVKAYKVLEMVISESATDPTSFKNSGNVFAVTDAYDDFFSSAKAEYTTNLGAANTVYLTYDKTAGELVISDTAPSGTDGKDFIKLDTKTTKLDKTYFGADIISRLKSDYTISNNAVVAPDNTASANQLRLFSDWLSAYTVAKSITGTAGTAVKDADGEKTTKFTFDLPYGYYLVLTSDAGDNDGEVINQSILNIPNVTDVTLKASPISTNKSVSNGIDANLENNGLEVKVGDPTTKDTDGDELADEITASIGDQLVYAVDTVIPSLTSYDLSSYETPLTKNLNSVDAITTYTAGKYSYVFYDVMINQDINSSGITVDFEDAKFVVFETKEDNKTVQYLINNDDKSSVTDENVRDTYAIARLSDTGYKVEDGKGSNFFSITFDLNKLKTFGLDNQKITINYKARLMGEAGNADSTNKANVTYSSNPYSVDEKETTEDVNKVYTFDVKVDKAFSDGTDHSDGVTFTLYSDEACENAIAFVGADGVYTRADNNDKDEDKVTVLELSDSAFAVHGLGEGTYYLKEAYVEDADGKTLKDKGFILADTIKIVITAKNGTDILSENLELAKTETVNDEAVSTITSTVTVGTDVDIEPEAYAENYGIEFEVLNQKGFSLPITGEMGVWLFAIIGILLVGAGAFVLVKVNRKKEA